MAHASDLKGMHNPKFLIYGKTGGGKTTLFRTIPGRKFLYMFDPAGMNSILPGDDITYEEFLVDTAPMNVNTLKGTKDSESPNYSNMESYVKWEQDFENRLSKNWFNDPSVIIDGVPGGFDAIGFDSLTTLADLVMDRVLQLNMRAGKNPEIADYGIQTNTLARIIRNAAATNCIIYLTAHEQAVQDKLLKTVNNEIMVTGQLKVKLPLLFSEIYHAYGMVVGGKPEYKLMTVAEDMYPLARCSQIMRDSGIAVLHDATIKDASNPTLFGLGPVLNKLRPPKFSTK